jgi:hypothetical protein
VPLLFEEFLISIFSRTIGALFYAMFDGALRCLGIMVSRTQSIQLPHIC